MTLEQKLLKTVVEIPDFPKPGISFKDIAPIFTKPALCNELVAYLANEAKKQGANVIAGVESRGFILGAAIALEANLPFVMIRKKGKLPGKVVGLEFELEYGSDIIEVQENAFSQGDKVFLHDDILATGGTAEAAAKLVDKVGARVCGFGFIGELSFLNGVAKINGIAPVNSVIRF